MMKNILIDYKITFFLLKSLNFFAATQQAVNPRGIMQSKLEELGKTFSNFKYKRETVFKLDAHCTEFTQSVFAIRDWSFVIN